MKALFLVALLFPLTLAVPVNDSEEKVLTPAGMLPASSVHSVPEGGSINFAGDHIQLLDATGKAVHVAQVNGTKKRAFPQPERIAYADWQNPDQNSPISYFTTTWSVPPTPATDNGQSVFLYISIEPASYAATLQPVLQFGPSAAGGGPYWTVANWYLYGLGLAYYTAPVNVTVGQTLQAIISLTASSDAGYSYASLFDGVGEVLNVTNITQLVLATETLESLNIQENSDYPAGSTVFSAINLYTTSGTPSFSWSVTQDVSDKLYVNVEEDGAVDGRIEIKYPPTD